MTPDRRAAILRAIFWIAIVLSFLAAINPQPPQLPGQPNDKVQHIMAFLMLGALAFFAFPRTSPIKLLVGLSAFGALIEFTQMIPALHRDGDIMDWIADTAAAAVILTVLHLLRRPTAAGEEGNG
jgi:VanZ family protein